jgi:hypothetical protein
MTAMAPSAPAPALGAKTFGVLAVVGMVVVSSNAFRNSPSCDTT